MVVGINGGWRTAPGVKKAVGRTSAAVAPLALSAQPILSALMKYQK